MKSYLILVFIFFKINSLESLSGQESYKKIIHNIDKEAKCLDGTPGFLYMHEGGDPKNILIFFPGGGFCGSTTLDQTLQNCYQRSKTNFGSSKYSPEQFIGQGYLSSDPNVSKFATWTKFIFGYCDGSLHQGWSKPIRYKDTELYFRGAAITRSHFDWIDSKYDLKGAQKIILTGASAGGIGVNIWNNYLREYVRNPNSIYSISDSGVYMIFKTYEDKIKVEYLMENLFMLANGVQSTPVTECNYLNKGNQWKCLFIQNTYTTIKGKFMIVNSQYDLFTIPNLLDIQCLKDGWYGGATLSNCTTNQINYLEKYRQFYRQIMRKFLKHNVKASIWSIACSGHTFASKDMFYNSANYTIPTFTGKKLKQVIQQFVLSDNRILQYDLQGWPSNYGCAF